MNITIDDTSPLLQYITVDKSSTWERDNLNLSDDEKLSSYYGSTMSKTTGEGDYMSFTFNGTAVYVYGSKRKNHGVYSASIDGGEPVLQSGKGSPPGEFQAVLYQATDLDPGQEHTVQITNLPSQTDRPNNNTANLWLDIDFVIVTAKLPSESNGTVYTTRIDDTSPACVYTGDEWDTGPPMNPPQYYNSTAHITRGNTDTVICSFNGTSVEVLGGLMSDHDNYTVSIDDGPPMAYNGSYAMIHPQATLFLATQLSDGPHTMRLTNIIPDRFVDLDYMIVNSTIPPPSTNGTTTETPVGDNSLPATGSQALTLPQLVGLTVAVVLGTIAVLLAGLMLWRRRSSRAFRGHRFPGGTEKTSAIDLNGAEVTPYTAYTGVSPITNHWDSKYSPDYPTPLKTGAAFFPYSPDAPPTAASQVFRPPSSSLGRNRDLPRQTGARAQSDTSAGSTDDTDPSRGRDQPSEAGTFGPAATAEWQGDTIAQAGPHNIRGSTVNVPPPVPTSRTSFASLARMYHQRRTSMTGHPVRWLHEADSELSASTCNTPEDWSRRQDD